MTKTPKPVPVPASARHHRHRQSLAQTRLASASTGLKSVRRHKTRTPSTSTTTEQQLRQAGLASFGFAKDTPATDTPQPPPQHRAKRRKRLPREEVEVPETQFDQSTQSPEFDHTNNNNDDGYSSPLSSPPPLPDDDDDDGDVVGAGAAGSQASVSSRAAMPPPPVTPKRRKVLEIPDSKSPPVTPFSPYQPSQHQPGMQVLFSPTGRLGRSPMGGQVEKGVDTGAAEEGGCSQMWKRTGRRLFATGPKRAREEEDDTARPPEPAKEPPPEAITTGTGAEAPAPAPAPVNRDKIVNSSQWWEVEEDAPLSTQATQTQTQSRAGTDTETQDSIATVLLPESQKPAIRHAQEQEHEPETETFRVDLTYNEPEPEDFEAPESQDPTRAAAGQDESQGSFHSMTYPPPHPFRDDTPEGNAPAEQPIPLPDAVDDTASEEDPEEDEDAPHYKPYHTQQLPSSFWQTNATYTQLPQQNELLLGSQWAPEAVRRKYSTAALGDTSQWVAPEIVQLPKSPMKEDVDVEEEDDGEEDDKEPSQSLPGPDDGESSQVLPGSEEVPATPTQVETKKGGRRGEFKFHIPDDDEDVTIATSQLLPSELMETFPMPPPLSQFSSYGYGDLSFESETQ